MNKQRLGAIVPAIILMIASLLTPQLTLADAYEDFMAEPDEQTAFSYLHQVATHPRCANCHGKVTDGAHRPTWAIICALTL